MIGVIRAELLLAGLPFLYQPVSKLRNPQVGISAAHIADEFEFSLCMLFRMAMGFLDLQTRDSTVPSQ